MIKMTMGNGKDILCKYNMCIYIISIYIININFNIKQRVQY